MLSLGCCSSMISVARLWYRTKLLMLLLLNHLVQATLGDGARSTRHWQELTVQGRHEVHGGAPHVPRRRRVCQSAGCLLD